MQRAVTKLAILGLGSRSTAFYIEQLNSKYAAIKKGYSTCPFTLLNADFQDINPYLPDQFELLAKNLKPYLRGIEDLNPDMLIIPNITLHETFDLMPSILEPRIKVVHPVNVTVEELLADDQNRVVLFGSGYSMKAPYLTSYFQSHSITIARPDADQMKFIDSFRRNIYLGTESQDDIDRYLSLVEYYTSESALVIGCTELSLYSRNGNSNLYDMAQIQMDTALRMLI